jgi:acyl-CoA thioesterase-1
MMVCRIAAVASVFVAASACATERSPAGPSTGGSTPIIVVLGDSLTSGPGLRRDETWPALLERRLRAEGYRYTVVNAGVSGDTSTEALQRLDSALAPDVRILIVALGINDGLQGVPVSTLKSNLTKIIERARQRGISVLLCGMETPPTMGFRYMIDFHNVYPALAQTYDLPLMPFLLLGVVGRPELNQPDGIHPNAAGARVIANNVWPYLQPMLAAGS